MSANQTTAGQYDEKRYQKETRLASPQMPKKSGPRIGLYYYMYACINR